MTSCNQNLSTPETCSKGETCFIWGVTLLFFAAILFVVGSAIGGIWDWYTFQKVDSVESAGQIAGATYSSSFSHTKTAVRTERGTYLVMGVVQGIHGHSVRIETRGNGERVLCVEETGVCKRMAEE